MEVDSVIQENPGAVFSKAAQPPPVQPKPSPALSPQPPVVMPKPSMVESPIQPAYQAPAAQKPMQAIYQPPAAKAPQAVFQAPIGQPQQPLPGAVQVLPIGPGGAPITPPARVKTSPPVMPKPAGAPISQPMPNARPPRFLSEIKGSEIVEGERYINYVMKYS